MTEQQADEPVDQQQLAEQLLAQAKEQGVDLVGKNGLLRWNPALNAFAIAFEGRITLTGN